MRLLSKLFTLAFFVLPLALPAQAQPEDDEAAVSAVLDAFHEAASKADGTRYFSLFTDEAVFLGTDITERWTVDEFKAYAMPYFDQGRGWTYVMQSRHIYLSSDAGTAWFDEILLNERFGETRGSGVLVQVDGQWKVAQYHLTLPVPNDLIFELVKMIEKQAQQDG